MNLFLDVKKKIVLRDNTLLFSTIFGNKNKHFKRILEEGKKIRFSTKEQSENDGDGLPEFS